MRLLYDTCRCNGTDCERRERCERYLQRTDLGPRTPISDVMCQWDSEGEFVDFIIEREGQPPVNEYAEQLRVLAASSEYFGPVVWHGGELAGVLAHTGEGE